jgi:hypothetical protein
MDRVASESEIRELNRLLAQAQQQIQAGRDDARRQAQLGLNVIPLWKLLNASSAVFTSFRYRRDFLAGISGFLSENTTDRRHQISASR